MAGIGNGTSVPPMIHRELNDEMTTDNLDFQLTTVSAVNGPAQPHPSAYSLSANFPNPFNPETEIHYSLPAAGPLHALRIAVYDRLGRRVKILFEGAQPAGTHSIRWDGTDEQGRLLPSGVYMLRFQADGFNETRKMALSR
jgi:hypothetical protein